MMCGHPISSMKQISFCIFFRLSLSSGLKWDQSRSIICCPCCAGCACWSCCHGACCHAWAGGVEVLEHLALVVHALPYLICSYPALVALHYILVYYFHVFIKVFYIFILYSSLITLHLYLLCLYCYSWEFLSHFKTIISFLFCILNLVSSFSWYDFYYL